MGRTPERGTVLRGEDGLALVVADNTDPLDALLELLDIEYGGEFSRTNPVLVKEADDLKVEVWRYCTKAFCEAECIGDDPDQDWWAPHGDGARSIHVVSVERSIWVIGEEAEAAELAPLGDLMAEAERDDRVLLARTWNDNPSGRLWEARWFRSGGRYYRDVDAPGVFVPAHEFPNEATFWADFEDERAKFHGMRAGDSRD